MHGVTTVLVQLEPLNTGHWTSLTEDTGKNAHCPAQVHISGRVLEKARVPTKNRWLDGTANNHQLRLAGNGCLHSRCSGPWLSAQEAPHQEDPTSRLTRRHILCGSPCLGHRHVPLMHGRAQFAQTYPRQLCRSTVQAHWELKVKVCDDPWEKSFSQLEEVTMAKVTDELHDKKKPCLKNIGMKQREKGWTQRK